MKKFLVFIVLVALGSGGYFYFVSDGFKRPIDLTKDVVVPLQDLSKKVQIALGPKTVGIEDIKMPIEDEPVEEIAQEEAEEAEPVEETKEVIEEDNVEEPEVTVTEEEKGVEIDGAGEIGKAFEKSLNGLIKGIDKALDGYTEKRDQMTAMVDNDNLRDAELVQKNVEKMEALVKELRSRAGDVVESFKAADSEIEELISALPAEERPAVRKNWEDLVEQHVGLYRRFFTREGEAAAAYQRLLRFYANREGKYTYNPDTDRFEFDNPNDKIFAQQMHVEVNRMQRAQGRALKLAD